MSHAALISYAQNFEDVILWRALHHVEKGFYIDIGAQDPVIDSVSLGFYEQGWRGVHVEPTVAYADKLRAARPEETVIQAAIARDAGLLHFYEIAETGLSTADRSIAESHRKAGFTVTETDVPAISLDTLLDRFAGRDIHWLKIDVEGFESEVLAGWRDSSVRPWVVMVESTLPGTQIQANSGWEPILLSKGYHSVHFDGLNRYYLSEAHGELAGHFGTGPNCFDEFVLSGTSTSRFCKLLLDKVADREAEIASKDRDIEFRDQEIVLRNQDIEFRNQELIRKDQDSLLKDQENERIIEEIVAQKDKVIASRDALLAHKDEIIARRDRDTAKLKNDLEDKIAVLEKSEAHFKNVATMRQEEVDELFGKYNDALKKEEDALKAAELDRNIAHHERLALLADISALHADIGTLHEDMAVLNMEIARLHAHIHLQQGQMDAFRTSWSWRLTAPLRTVLNRGRSLRRTIPDLPRRVRRLPARLIEAIRARPALKRRLIALVERVPGLSTRLRQVAQASRHVAVQSAAAQLDPSTAGLSLSARRLQHRLVAARTRSARRSDS